MAWIYRIKSLTLLLTLVIHYQAEAQLLQELILDTSNGLVVKECMTVDSQLVQFQTPPPLFTFEVNEVEYSSDDCQTIEGDGTIQFNLADQVYGVLTYQKEFSKGWKATVVFQNITIDTLRISNVVPFGRSEGHIYITGAGPWAPCQYQGTGSCSPSSGYRPPRESHIFPRSCSHLRSRQGWPCQGR